jgi:glycerol-3-phosphate dehydrogenase (NAD(P)+)
LFLFFKKEILPSFLMPVISIIGAGAWGTALAIHAAHLGHDVFLVARHPERIGAENPRLAGVVLPPTVRVCAEPPCTAVVTLIAVPTQHVRATLLALGPAGPLLLCCKGLEHDTGLFPLEIAAAALPGCQATVLTGPNFAREIAAGMPAASVIAGGDAALRTMMLDLLAGPTFRLYGNDDAVGAQLGGAAKNVVAVAAGAVTGAGLGENARAALVTRGLAEIARLATALGGRADTVTGLSGLGDLVLTCTGASSRNFGLGFGLGRGVALSDLVSEAGPVVEGIATAPAILKRAGGVELPIIRAVADLLAGSISLQGAISRLLARPLKDE